MLDSTHIKALKNIVGAENCYDDKAHLLAYCYDATRERYEPEAVYSHAMRARLARFSNTLMCIKSL